MKLKNWKMNFLDYGTLDCTPPCSMYSVLRDFGKIEDPFYGLNEQELISLSDNDCEFICDFEITEDQLKCDYTELIFDGLDTLCDIYFNGVLLANVKNMHRRYTFDVKKYAMIGNNKIRLYFHSPTQYFKKMNARHYTYTNFESIAGAAHLRKGLYMSGWDWGPSLPDMGIFRDVVLKCYNIDKIDNVAITQNHYDGKVDVNFTVETAKNEALEITAELDGKAVTLHNGKGTITVENPRLWWPNNLGEQNLYDVAVSIKKDGKVIDTVTKTIGLRTLTVSTQKDSLGNEFCFVVNGQKVFAMGANYIPQNSFYSRINRQTTQKLIDSVVDANHNCIRVWGGGYYPEDDFYDICDRAGLMVWEDMMVACANIWLTDEMKEEFEAEARYNIKRIHHHPSLALICGNNEMEMAVIDWEGVKGSELVKRDYLELYEKLLFRISLECAPDTFYWPSSPSSGGGFENPGDYTRGDVHYWLVWHGGIPFEEYRKHKFRFCSEYGFESFPNIKTIRSFCDEEDMNPFSRVMENHQKCLSGNGKILGYMADKYLYPTKFENLVYASQILQAEAIKLGVEHFRRIRGICMGSIYWQLNDCWPVASWSSVDHYGRYKALHYECKKFYAPLACGIFRENDNIIVNVANETLESENVTLKWGICHKDFSEIAGGEEKVTVKKLSSKDVFTVDLSDHVIDKYNDYYYVDLYDKNGKFLMRRTEMFTVPKRFNWTKPNVKVEAEQSSDTVTFKISCDTFCKGVMIDFNNHDVTFSDNFFDITANKEYNITCKTSIPVHQLLEDMVIKTVYDIR